MFLLMFPMDKDLDRKDLEMDRFPITDRNFDDEIIVNALMSLIKKRQTTVAVQQMIRNVQATFENPILLTGEIVVFQQSNQSKKYACVQSLQSISIDQINNECQNKNQDTTPNVQTTIEMEMNQAERNEKGMGKQKSENWIDIYNNQSLQGKANGVLRMNVLVEISGTFQ